MNDDAIPRCIMIAVLVLLGGFFAGAATAFSHCNRGRRQSPAEDGGGAGLCGPVCKVGGLSDFQNGQVNRGVEKSAG